MLYGMILCIYQPLYILYISFLLHCRRSERAYWCIKLMHELLLPIFVARGHSRIENTALYSIAGFCNKNDSLDDVVETQEYSTTMQRATLNQ